MKKYNKPSISKNTFMLLWICFTDKISSLLSNSVIIKFIENLFLNADDPSKKGVLHISYGKATVFKTLLNFRMYIASKFEKSMLAQYVRNRYNTISSLSLRSISVFLFTYGILLITGSTLSENGLSLFIDTQRLYIGTVMVIIAVLFFPSKKSVSDCISNSAFLSKFAFSVKFSSEDGLTRPSVHSYSAAFFFGAICGLASFLFSPAKILLCILGFICICAIFNHPETGLIIISALLPILASKYVISITTVTLISYLLKYIRGKRHFSTGNVEVLVFISAIIIMFSGIFTLSLTSSIHNTLSSVICLMLIILASNLIRSGKTALSCINMLINGALAVTFFNLIFYILMYTEISKEISKYFSVTEIFSALNIFSGKNELGFYCAMIIPLVCSFMINSPKEKRSKHILLLSLLFVCMIISGSNSAFCISIFSLIVTLSFCNKAYTALIIPYIIFIRPLSTIPEFILNTIGIQFSNEQISGTQLFSHNISEVISDIWLFGAGIGENIATGTPLKHLASILSSGNLLLYTIATLGVFGVMYMVVALLYFLFKSYRYIVSNEHKDNTVQTAVIGLFGSHISFILLSTFSCTVTDARLVMMFLLYLGLSYASVKSSRDDHISEYVVREHLPHC